MERLRHLVVVVPGIGGSVLADTAGRPVWGPGLPQIAGGVLWPDRLSLSEQQHLVPVGLLPTIGVFPPLLVPGYDRLVRQICNAFADARVDTARHGAVRDPRADVVLFPYDFRVGVRAAAEELHAEIEARLTGLTSQARRQRVIVVAHSMGGLVARYWLGPLHGAADCRALITLGTPHRGAPKALDWLVNGVRAGPKTLQRATRILAGWPSAYDLLPRYPVVWPREQGAEPTAAQAGRSMTGAGPAGVARPLYAHELSGVGPYGFARRAADAYAMHVDIEKEWGELASSPRGPEVIAVFARGHATPGRAVFVPGGVRVTKQDPEWLPNRGWRGDGTVPANSAIPIELDDDRRAWTAVAERHVPMASAPVVIDILRSYAGASLAAMRGETPDRPWLGLDLDDVVAAGQPVPVGVDLLGGQAREATVVWVTVRSADGSGYFLRLRCLTADGGWQVLVPPLDAGLYRVSVEAVNVPGVDRVACEDVVAVVTA